MTAGQRCWAVPVEVRRSRTGGRVRLATSDYGRSGAGQRGWVHRRASCRRPGFPQAAGGRLGSVRRRRFRTVGLPEGGCGGRPGLGSLRTVTVSALTKTRRSRPHARTAATNRAPQVGSEGTSSPGPIARTDRSAKRQPSPTSGTCRHFRRHGPFLHAANGSEVLNLLRSTTQPTPGWGSIP
jgi:hypothetical protein